MAQTLCNALAWWARNQPDLPALVSSTDTLTYGEYKAWSERVAARLVADGLQPGERVAICAANGIPYAVLIQAIIRAGGIASPISPRYTPREIAELCASIEPTFLFAAPEQHDQVAGAGYAVRPMAEIEALREGAPATVAHDPQPDASVCIIATSGSTATPKGVVYTHAAMTAHAANWAIEQRSSRPGLRAVCLPPFNTSGGMVQLMHYMVLGWTIHLQAKFEPERMLALIQQERINVFAGAPAFFEFMAALPAFEKADLSSIEMAVAGGARVTRKLLDAYRAKGIIIRQNYGQTEIGGYSTIMPEHLAAESPEKCGWGGIFMDQRVVRPDGSDCEPGEPGEIIMRSPGMMKEYWRKPEETAKAIRNGWLYSGDIGTLDERGLLTFIDRQKDLIISGGLNISAAEVERVVLEFDNIVEALVIAAPDNRFGETPFLVYHSPEAVDVQALIRHCNEQLADYKVPRYVVHSPEPLPRLATGKLSKPAVRERYAGAHEHLPRVR